MTSQSGAYSQQLVDEAHRLLNAGRTTEAAQSFQRALAANPANHAAAANLGRLEMMAGRQVDAVAPFQQPVWQVRQSAFRSALG
jgi:Flp pilus assembly protein TadD